MFFLFTRGVVRVDHIWSNECYLEIKNHLIIHYKNII